jgi:hypothetical protein
MTLRHLDGTYDSLLFWITDFPVWDVGSNTTTHEDHQKPDFMSEQRSLYAGISKEPSMGGPLIFNCYKSINLEAVTGLTFFYGFEGALSAMNDVHGHTPKAPHATIFRGTLRSVVDRFEMRGGRRVHVPIAAGDRITELAILKVKVSQSYHPVVLVRIFLPLSFPSTCSNLFCIFAQCSPVTSG